MAEQLHCAAWVLSEAVLLTGLRAFLIIFEVWLRNFLDTLLLRHQWQLSKSVFFLLGIHFLRLLPGLCWALHHHGRPVRFPILVRGIMAGKQRRFLSCRSSPRPLSESWHRAESKWVSFVTSLWCCLSTPPPNFQNAVKFIVVAHFPYVPTVSVACADIC